jgi:NADH dehydrogenase FAD-containing subunit
MRNVVILGSGAGGTMVANTLQKELDGLEWQITIIDREEERKKFYFSFGAVKKSHRLRPGG